MPILIIAECPIYVFSLRVLANRLKYQKILQTILPGDLVTWKLNDKMVHIGIVSEQESLNDPERHQIVHNIGGGPENK